MKNTPSNKIEIQYREKLKKLSTELEFFAHITSHDLRDPLRQARIYSDELLENLQDKKVATKLTQINDLIDNVLQKIVILREYSYIANASPIYEAINLNVVIYGILGEIKKKITKTNAKIIIGSLPDITGNPGHIKILFRNLILNALEFASPQTSPIIEIKSQKDADFQQFTIKDNGIGLEELYRELVFVLFQKLDNETGNTRLGAGLAFAKKIVENHGGKIWYESDGENGTCFHFTLPDAAKKQSSL